MFFDLKRHCLRPMIEKITGIKIKPRIKASIKLGRAESRTFRVSNQDQKKISNNQIPTSLFKRYSEEIRG